MIKAEGFTDVERERFRRWQSVSYAVLHEVAGQLQTGSTERDATRLAMKAYRREGADRFFHLPVALFGKRTALPDPWTVESFWPTTRALAPGDSIILDASPTFEGFVVDTSISLCFAAASRPDQATARPDQATADHATAMADNLAYRERVLDAVRTGATFREIAIDVDAHLRSAGYENRHCLHPEAVLGHRVVRFTDLDTIPPVGAGGFDTFLLDWFVEGTRQARRHGSVPPTWNDRPVCHHRPAPGLWAVEPHIARGSAGVKWEELLEITDSDAYWLSDAVPHLVGPVR